ncbi:MAG: hypothetical protein JXA20_06635 [Spirochaetes bacterium]|nr:hypothetical protein [Spirochaetota bacterium]
MKRMGLSRVILGFPTAMHPVLGRGLRAARSRCLYGAVPGSRIVTGVARYGWNHERRRSPEERCRIT